MHDDGSLPILARESEAHMERLLSQYKPLVLSLVARVTRSAREEYVQAGAEAVMEAALAYDERKGAFGALAKRVVTRRLLDMTRRDGRFRETPLSELPEERRVAIEAAAARQAHNIIEETETRRQEIAEYALALGKLGMTLPDLQKSAPKHEATRKTCREAIWYLYSDPALREQTLAGRLPIRQLCERFHAGDKLFERHRRYIVGAVLALAGDYPHIRAYIGGGEER